MLIEFSVANFKSFRDRVTFSMLAANIASQDKSVSEENVIACGDGIRLLRSAVIYGANASGKSNFAAAVEFMRHFVLTSSQEIQADGRISVEPFLLADFTEDSPSTFEVVFLLDGKQYRYGFEVTRDRVVAEWLFFRPTTREARLFVRELDDIEIGERFREGRRLAEKTRPNALFLSVVAQFNGTIAQSVISWFARFLTIVGLLDEKCRAYTFSCFENNQNVSEITRLLKKLDLGIHGIGVEKYELSEDRVPANMPEPIRQWILEQQMAGRSVRTEHKKYDREGRLIGIVNFDLDEHESQGTQKLFSFSGPFVETLRKGTPLLVDEFDARLHHNLTRALIEVFNSSSANPNNAQLIFTTHDTGLLSKELFRRDQIWFVEKDRYGASTLRSLVEHSVRYEASFQKEYLEGRYAAIPFIVEPLVEVGEPSATET